MLSTIFLFLIIGSCALLALFAVLVVAHRRQLPAVAVPSGAWPAVSILKPLKGTDVDLAANLESYCRSEYPDFEIIFGVDTADDPAVAVVEEVRRRFPDVRATLVVTGADKELNPKIESLAVMAARATGRLYWVTDANTRVAPATLRNLAAEYCSSGAKIVFSPICGTGSQSFGSIMENAYLNLFVAGSIIAAWQFFGKAIIMGKSMLIEKEALHGIGGFLRFREYLAEDFIMGEIYREHGCYIATNYTWVTNYNRHTTVARFCARLSRWAKMRARIERMFYAAEILANPVGMAALAVLVPGGSGWRVFGAALAVKVLLEYLVFFAVNRSDRRRAWLMVLLPVSVLVKDLLMVVLYVIPFFNNTVNWHGRKIAVGARSTICPAGGNR